MDLGSFHSETKYMTYVAMSSFVVKKKKKNLGPGALIFLPLYLSFRPLRALFAKYTGTVLGSHSRLWPASSSSPLRPNALWSPGLSCTWPRISTSSTRRCHHVTMLLWRLAQGCKSGEAKFYCKNPWKTMQTWFYPCTYKSLTHISHILNK